jgi:hypothetical protein
MTTAVAPRRLTLGGRAAARFWPKVQIGRLDECWLWMAARDANGYGLFLTGSRTDGSRYAALAHRVAYEFGYGGTDGLCVLHHCDNPPCCNPQHLFLGTLGDNSADRDLKGRQSKGERHSATLLPEKMARCGSKNGHALLDENTIREIRAKYGRGVCQKELAVHYGVGVDNIKAVVQRKTWRHVA